MAIENATPVDVDSSNITSVAYDSADKILRVVFKNGSTYDYAAVPVATYNGMIAAESVGKYFHAHVRNAFEYRKR